MTRKARRIRNGALAGLAAGLAGTFAMTQFQALWSKLQKSSDGAGGDDPATVKAALAIFPFSEKSKKFGGEIVHYGVGSLSGAVYGALAEISPAVRAGAGSLFGLALFLAADETLVPLLGLSKPPQAYPLSAHAYGLASHLIYGLATDGTRRALRPAR